jgi:LmbE family N-acetylglucosaminyl deacetylase
MRKRLELPPGPVLVISPHLDDAVFSVGGFLWELRQSGRNVTVVTTMAGIEGQEETKIGAQANRSGGLDSTKVDPFQVRRTEDIRAMDVLGIRYLHLDRETALNRTRADGTPLYPTADHIQSGPTTDDATFAAVVDALRHVDQTIEHRSVLGPIGHGGHPDHKIVHAALMEAFAGQPLFLWYDRPYSSGYRLRNPLAIRVPMALIAATKKVEASNCYESQTAQLYLSTSPTDEILGDRVETFIKGTGAQVVAEKLVRRIESWSHRIRTRLSPGPTLPRTPNV